MNFLKFFFVFFHIILISSTSFANTKIAFIDVDLILSESEPSKKLFSQLKIIEDKRINELKINEINLKEEEKKISKTKNIISKEEFNKRVNIFKDKVENYQKSKNKVIEDIKKTRNKEIIRFFKLINPIIEKIMDENSIEILIEKKNIFMAKSDNDITKIVIENVNKNIKEFLIEDK
jgi:outer membrane protein|tara:strand:+ start:961 stop:1491 length:531 start_codon:yes stop_codon:yes gene_type:complete